MACLVSVCAVCVDDANSGRVRDVRPSLYWFPEDESLPSGSDGEYINSDLPLLLESIKGYSKVQFMV